MKTRVSLVTGVGLLVPLLLTFWMVLGGVAAPAGAAEGAALLDSCNWTGNSNTLWSNGDNWSCSRAPTSDDDVTIPSGAKQPFLNAAATVATLKMDGGWLTIGGSGSLTVTGAADVSSNSHITNDGQYSAASTTVQIGAELIAGGLGTFAGPFTVQWFATLEPGAGTVLTLLGDLSNYGTLKPLAGGGSFIFRGENLVNDGQAEDANLVVDGSGSHYLSGSGTWKGTGRLRVNATTVQLASDVAYEATLLDLSAGGRLDLGAHTLGLPGGGTVLSLPPGTVIAGSGEIAASGGGRIGNDGVISPTLHVLGQGISAGGFGPFAGPLVVDAGATLTVTQYSNVLATGDVTVTGTLGPGSYLLFGGRNLTNNGAIKVSTVQFQGGAQALKGTGHLSPTTMVRVMAGTTMTLASDHQLGSLQIASRGAADISGRTLSLWAAGNALQRTGTLTMTNSTVVYNGTAPQTVAAQGNLYHNLTIANAAGASAGTPAFPLSSSGLLRVQSGTFTSPSCNCNDVQIDAGGRLALFSNAAYRLAGDWTNNGTYAPAAGDTVTFAGPESQSIGGSSVTLFGALAISNTAGVKLNASAGVTRTLTLKGDLTATGSSRLALDAGATTAGTGDVWGAVDRRGPLSAQHAYSFGNPDNRVTFANAGTLPSSFSVTLANTRPEGLPGALPRKVGLAFTDGSVYSATLRLHYRDSDLAGLSEPSIAPWLLVGETWKVQPSSAASAAQNWVERAGVTGPGDWGLAAPATSISRVEINQALGRQYQDAQKYVAGKDTAIRVFVSPSVVVDPSSQQVVVRRDGNVVATLSPVTAGYPTKKALTFVCPSRAACGEWQAGSYTFEVTVNEVVTQTSATFQNRRSLRILAVPVRVTDRGARRVPPTDEWKSAGSFLSKVYPIAGSGLQWELGPEIDATWLDLTGPLGQAALWTAAALRQPFGCGLPSQPACYDQILAFIPPMPICNDRGCIGGWTLGSPAAVIMANGSFTLTVGGRDETQRIDDMQAIVAHEVGHNYGLGDEYTNGCGLFLCGVNPPPASYRGRLWLPFPACDYSCSSSTEQEWPDGGSGSWVQREPSHPFDVISLKLFDDALSFMGSGSSQSNYWVTQRVYDHLFNRFSVTLQATDVSAVPVDAVQASGWIGRDDTVKLEPWYHFTAGLGTPITGSYTIEAVDMLSQTLASQGFEVSFLAWTDPPQDLDSAPFQVTVASPPGTKAFRIKRGATVLKVVPVTSHVPTVAVTAPAAGEMVSGVYTVTWQSGDLDGGTLSHRVLYSPDGQDWLVLGAGITDTKLAVDFSSVAGGGQARVKVMASDGVNSAEATGGAFQVPLKAPEVFIQAPLDGSSQVVGNDVLLVGSAYDLQDGWLGSAGLVWTSSRDGSLGSSGLLNVPSLSPGEHTITLTATNSFGLSASAAVHVKVGIWQYLPLIRRR